MRTLRPLACSLPLALLLCACGPASNTVDAASGDDAPSAPDSAGGDTAASALDGGPASMSDAAGTTSEASAPDGAPPVAASCRAAPGGGSAQVAAPQLARRFADEGREGWLASPAVADLDGDGRNELIVARGGRVYVWGNDGARRFVFDTEQDRVWASPAVGDFTADPGLELAVAARDRVFVVRADGRVATGFPQRWGTETRSLAAGDLDGDGRPEVVVGVRVRDGARSDVVRAYRGDGTTVQGFPPEATGTSGCAATTCYPAGLYDQNLAVGDLDGDRRADLVAPHDNAYASIYESTGRAFDAHAMFRRTRKTPGVRYLHTLAESVQGYANDEATGLQAHFTNTAPAVADLDGDGRREVILLGSVQNAAQSRRELGVGLWVVRSDASRVPGWERPFEVMTYAAGLWDGFAPTIDGAARAGASNLVGATNQVTVADIDPASPGPELLFAGFDGRIHAVTAQRRELWSTPFATDGRALTGGVVVADLSGDGAPEVLFATYSYERGNGALYVLDAAGAQRHRVALPGRGAMAVPTVASLAGDGSVEVFVSLKDAEPRNGSVLAFRFEGARDNCLPWPTGRANLLRNGAAN